MLQLVRKGDQLIFKSLAVCISIVDERNGVIVIAASVFLGLLILGIRPCLPAEKFFLAFKVITGQLYLIFICIGINDGVGISFIDCVVAFLVIHIFLQFISLGGLSKSK